MTILVSNDDGHLAPGINHLVEALKSLGGRVITVAPEIERSTTGHSLTLHKPLRIREVREDFYSVSGSPADCVYVATRKILKEKPDLLVSGINFGANLAQDVFYSGTVAAAREGSFFGIKSMAISLCLSKGYDPNHLFWNSACTFVKAFVPLLLKQKIPDAHVVNVNVPNLPIEKIKGVKLGGMGRRNYTSAVEECTDPRGKKYYWIGGSSNGHNHIAGSDCVHVEEGYISVVPIKSDATDESLRKELSAWEQIKL
jgi:5'-nucleotidase